MFIIISRDILILSILLRLRWLPGYKSMMDVELCSQMIKGIFSNPITLITAATSVSSSLIQNSYIYFPI